MDHDDAPQQNIRRACAATSWASLSGKSGVRPDVALQIIFWMSRNKSIAQSVWKRSKEGDFHFFIIENMAFSLRRRRARRPG
jgi:hypothetical protein